MTKSPRRFSSRMGLLLSMLGIAVGTGNVWRFPRIAAQNAGDAGAGGFIVAWIVCLLTWSLPLLVAEYAIGRRGRAGPVLAFARLGGGGYGILGGFVALVACGIMFYYAVVAGWCLYYAGISAAMPLPEDPAAARAVWDGFHAGWAPVALHALAVVAAYRAVRTGASSIERANRVLVPLLLAAIGACVVRAVTLPGASAGIAFLLRFDPEPLGRARTWLEALTQNAWDTGAGWGLVLTYAAYMRSRDYVVRNALVTGIGNNTVSLLSATMVFATVFSVLGRTMPQAEVLAVMQDSGPAATGLTFLWMPQLFAQMPAGRIFAVAFFGGLAFAALSSLIAMVEMAVAVLVDAGISRDRARRWVCGGGFVLGVPSALSLDVLGNQDFVWGVGLLVSGVLVALLVRRFGIERLFREVLDPIEGDLRWRTSLGWLLRWGVPVQGGVLLAWWIARAASDFASGPWWDPTDPYGVATCVVQWSAAGVLALLLARWTLGRAQQAAVSEDA